MIKYIGQHIVDFIARFRSDVYLENIADGTVANDKFLGLDSNNKIVKETVSAGTVDLTSGVTGTLPVGNGGTGATTLTNDSILTGTGTSAISAEPDLTYNATTKILQSSSSSSLGPYITLHNTDGGSGSSQFNFSNGASGDDGDSLGIINWGGQDDGGNAVVTWAQLNAKISDASDGNEEGEINMLLANPSGTPRTGFNLVSNGSNVIDANIGYGATSTTTVAGGLVVTQGRSVNVASGSQKPIGMQIARRTITTGEANNMDSVPIELIPAQGANTIIEISNVIARADRASAQSNGALNMDVHYADKEPGTYGSASLAHFRRFGYGETTDFIERRVISQATSGLTLTEDVNKAVEISFSAAASTDCFTSIDMYVTYFVIDIS